MDPVFEAIAASEFAKSSVSFEKFSRVSPFSSKFQKYLNEMIEWEISLLPAEEGALYSQVRRSLGDSFERRTCYYTQTDLVALLQTE